MKLYVLGKNNDDKGTQLERLTVEILANQNYTNINTNEISNGGNEIDVIAIHKYSLGVQTIECPIICECKAYDKPINMNDWLKFIGKITLKRQENSNTYGLFIALNGANGNVIGSYNALKEHIQVQLIANDDLIELIRDHYNITDFALIKEQIQLLYPINISNTNLVYYNQQIWWIIEFVNGKYTIWNKINENMGSEYMESLIQMINDYTPYTKAAYINLKKEANKLQLFRKINIYILSILLDEKKHSIQDIASSIKIYEKGNHISQDSIIEIINENPFILHQQDTNTISLIEEKLINFIDFYQYLFSFNVPIIKILQTSYYQRHINISLLQEIYKIQNNFNLSSNLEEDCLFLLKHSPSALQYALKPDPFLVYGKEGGSIKEVKDLIDTYFIDNLTQYFIKDFRSKKYGWLYHKHFKIHNIRTNTSLKVNGENLEKEFNAIREAEIYHHEDFGVMLIEKIIR